MDMLDQALDSSSQDKANDSASDDASQIHSDVTEGVEEQHAATAIASVTSQALLDPSIQYQFRTENGQGVTYRVVQVAPETVTGDAVAAGGTQVVTSAALVGQQVAQAIISSPFANANGSSSPTAEGQFYVMMSPQDVLQTTPRTLAPRTHQFSQKSEGNRTARDERRRATHNEVERRRRDKINNWIVKLSKIIPDCSSDLNKSGQQSSVHLHSKGGILAKACDYIQDLRNANARLPDILKENERLAVDVELLRQQCEELKSTNQILKAHLQQHGITIAEQDQHTS
ncbi:upstream stimulatory factor 2-like isoform X2 [Ornithodoros turicata]|uniref:upstream stimulatory factor 2-like isoform X2 n=1 Tax=Ornithodoros turicata TaxID=34597 RepID=UPI003138CFFE